MSSNGQLLRLEDLAGSGPVGPPGLAGPTGPAGPAGQDGEDGTVDTSNFENKQHFDFLRLANTPSIGTYPGQGISVWDNQEDLMSTTKKI